MSLGGILDASKCPLEYHVAETYPCSGCCGLRLDKPDSFCLSCWPKKMAAKRDKPKTVRQLRMELWNAAYKLAMGTKAESDAALETISHLTFVLQQTKETK